MRRLKMVPETNRILDMGESYYVKIYTTHFHIIPGNIDIKQGYKSRLLGEGYVEGEAEDEGVDLEVDGQPVDQACEQEHLLLVQVDGEQDQGNNDRLGAAPRRDIHDQGIVQPCACCQSRHRL